MEATMPLGLGKSRRELAEVTDEDVGWLDAGVEVEGKMTVATGMIRLNTHFKGEIQCQGTILVNDQAEIEAVIHTKFISISGKVKGAIHASERLEIKEKGIVLGDIYTPSLVIEPGGYFDGQCHMPTSETDKQAAKDLDSKEQSA
jgi:cytoskeletal protein CcmA (bactofilin family)